MDDSITFGIGKQLIVNVPVDPRGVTDNYINDTTGRTVDTEGSENITRLKRSNILEIHATSRPKHKNEPIPREEMAASNKLLVEAMLEETKTILGWVFDFRRLTISPPDNKCIAWSEAIQEILDNEIVTAKELEKIYRTTLPLGTSHPICASFYE